MIVNTQVTKLEIPWVITKYQDSVYRLRKRYSIVLVCVFNFSLHDSEEVEAIISLEITTNKSLNCIHFSSRNHFQLTVREDFEIARRTNSTKPDQSARYTIK